MGEFRAVELLTEMSNGEEIASKEIRVYEDVSASNRLDLSMGDLSRKMISGCELPLLTKGVLHCSLAHFLWKGKLA